MFTEKFTVFGSSLCLLKAGDRGVVTRVESANETTVQKLKAMGVVPGTTVTLKQRSPAYTIALGGDRLILCQKTASAIYVRLAEYQPSSALGKAGSVTRFFTSLFKRLNVT